MNLLIRCGGSLLYWRCRKWAVCLVAMEVIHEIVDDTVDGVAPRAVHLGEHECNSVVLHVLCFRHGVRA